MDLEVGDNDPFRKGLYNMTV
jgi:hypothetical protein